MRMPTSLQCIVLLVCLGICTSASISRCRCLRTVRSVRLDLVSEVRIIGVRPYCNKQEVIVQLTNNNSVCIDYNMWTKVMMQKWEKMKSTTSSNKATVTPTASAAILATVTQTL